MPNTRNRGAGAFQCPKLAGPYLGNPRLERVRRSKAEQGALVTGTSFQSRSGVQPPGLRKNDRAVSGQPQIGVQPLDARFARPVS